MAVLTGRAECRPRPSEVEAVSVNKRDVFIPEGQFGAVVGDVFAYTDVLTVRLVTVPRR